MTLPMLATQKPIQSSSGPMGAAAWIVGWSSANGPVTPFVVTLGSSLSAASSPPAADATEVTSVWSDGPPATTLQNFGVSGYAPPSGAARSLLQAIDAAVLAATVVYGDQVLEDADGTLRLALNAAWIIWSLSGGTSVPGGAGGNLQTLTLALG